MEEIVLKEMRKIVGFPNGDGDGIFCPGGSAANGYAISCARYHSFPEIKVSLQLFKKTAEISTYSRHKQNYTNYQMFVLF